MNSSTSSSDTLRRFLKKIALPWLLVMAVLATVGDYLFTENVVLNVEVEGACKVNRMFHTVEEGEIAIIGNSRVNLGFLPDSVSRKAWNYGMNGIGYPAIEMMLLQALRKKEAGRIIVGYDLNFFEAEAGNPNYYIPHYRSVPEVRKLLHETHEDHLYYYLPLFRYLGTVEWYTQRYLSSRNNAYTGCTYSRGAAICDIPFNENAKKRMQGVHNIMKPDSVFAQRLKNLLYTFGDKEVIFVTMPVHPEAHLHFTPSPEWLALEKELDALQNITLIHLRDENLPEEYFQDMTHLSAKGTRWLSREVRRRILEAGISIP